MKTLEYLEQQHSKLNRIASSMTGYFGAMAIYDVTIPKQTRIHMLEYLIKVWSENDSDSSLTKQWCDEWKKQIEEISK